MKLRGRPGRGSYDGVSRAVLQQEREHVGARRTEVPIAWQGEPIEIDGKIAWRIAMPVWSGGS